MIPDAASVARSGSVSNHWLTKSAELIVSSWMKVVCWLSGSAAKLRANPASAASPAASSCPVAAPPEPSSGLTKRAISAISSEYSSYASASRLEWRRSSRRVVA